MMRVGVSSTFFLLVALLAAPASASAAGSKQKVPAMGFMERRAAESDLLLALKEALGQGHGRELESLEDVSRSLAPTFASLPKNALGRIRGPALGHLIHGHFMKERGWLIKGLEPHRNVTDSDLGEMMPVLKKKVPSYIKSVFSEQKEKGFAVKDAVVLVALLEHLILDEGLGLLQQAYDLNGFSTEDHLVEEDLSTVFDSHLILWVFGQQRDYSNATLHRMDKAALKRWPVWQKQLVLVQDVHLNAVFGQTQVQNPFVDHSFSFDETAAILPALNQAYAEKHHDGCHGLRDGLIDLDPAVTGRVPLGQFYAAKKLGNAVLVETAEYLENLGALDNTEPGRGAQMIIPNYITSVSNCDAHSQFYSVCCVNQCEGILNNLEVHIRAPSAKPSQILDLVSEQRLSMMDVPKNLTSQLLGALDQIASLHDGEVPLHGRMFAQWLHYAFPHQCSYPYVTGTLTPLSPTQYVKDRGYSDEVSEDKKKEHMDAVVGDIIDPMSMWTEEEELRLGSTQNGSSYRTGATVFFGILQIVAGFTVLLGLWRSMAGTARGWVGSSSKPSSVKEYLV